MATAAILEAGKCRVCGCTDFDPCIYPVGGTEIEARCAWMEPDRTLCSNPACVAVIPLDELVEMFDRQMARLAETEP